MTQQNIKITKSTSELRDSFISHIKKAISESVLKNESFELSNLHNFLINKEILLQKGTDQATIFHEAVYGSFDKSDYFSSEFWKNYKLLCFEILDKLKVETNYFGEWAIQRFPTIRFQFPNNLSVFEFHRDSNYSHPLGEINCFYALNECKDTSALHIEKNLGFEDYLPLNLSSGEYAILNTSIFKHGDFVNKTNKTRVSMDFRFIPNKHLKDEKSSLTKGIKFTSSSYFISEHSMINMYT